MGNVQPSVFTFVSEWYEEGYWIFKIFMHLFIKYLCTLHNPKTKTQNPLLSSRREVEVLGCGSVWQHEHQQLPAGKAVDSFLIRGLPGKEANENFEKWSINFTTLILDHPNGSCSTNNSLRVGDTFQFFTWCLMERMLYACWYPLPSLPPPSECIRCYFYRQRSLVSHWNTAIRFWLREKNQG